MIKVSLADMLSHVDSQYRLLRIAGMRERQLSRGAKPRIEDAEGLKSTTIALREIAEGHVDFTIGQPPEPESEAESGDQAGQTESEDAA